MASPVFIFRQYTFDDSFSRVFVPSTIVNEYQIALTYATDNGGKGDFTPTWDLNKVTPKAISQFKEQNPDVTLKVFVSIGNEAFNPQIDSSSWITNATQSITNIINNNIIDKDRPQLQIQYGIDVLYNEVTAKPDVFVKCIPQVIKNLKDNGVISVASISPSSSLNKEFYFPLFNTSPTLIDWVDYQFQNEEATVPDPETLLVKYEELKKLYPVEKLFAGYSAENEDWGTVSPIVFFLGSMHILQKGGAAGFSIVYHNYYKPNSTRNQ